MNIIHQKNKKVHNFTRYLWKKKPRSTSWVNHQYLHILLRRSITTSHATYILERDTTAIPSSTQKTFTEVSRNFSNLLTILSKRRLANCAEKKKEGWLIFSTVCVYRVEQEILQIACIGIGIWNFTRIFKLKKKGTECYEKYPATRRQPSLYRCWWRPVRATNSAICGVLVVGPCFLRSSVAV